MGVALLLVAVGVAALPGALAPSPAGASVTTSAYAGNGLRGFSGDGGPATSATFYNPTGVTFDSAGNGYIADVDNNRVRKVDTTGIITTVAGNGVDSPLAVFGSGGFSGDGGPATNAQLQAPMAVAFDPAGNMYVADERNRRVRKVDARGTITTYAGNGTNLGVAGDGGPATSASLGSPTDLAFDPAGNLYINTGNDRIRKVDARTGVITAYAGTGSRGFSGDGGPATSAMLDDVTGIAFDASGNLYIADSWNYRIRKVDARTGTITTVAGTGRSSSSGDGGPATSASFYGPGGLTFDPYGNLFVGDGSNIREIDTSGTISTYASVYQGPGKVGFWGGNLYARSGLRDVKLTATAATAPTLTFDQPAQTLAGGGTATLAATVKDALGHPVTGAVVTFTRAGANGPISQSTSTSSLGRAVYSYTNEDIGLDTIQASTAGYPAATGMATVTWQPAPDPPGPFPMYRAPVPDDTPTVYLPAATPTDAPLPPGWVTGTNLVTEQLDAAAIEWTLKGAMGPRYAGMYLTYGGTRLAVGVVTPNVADYTLVARYAPKLYVVPETYSLDQLERWRGQANGILSANQPTVTAAVGVDLGANVVDVTAQSISVATRAALLVAIPANALRITEDSGFTFTLAHFDRERWNSSGPTLLEPGLLVISGDWCTAGFGLQSAAGTVGTTAGHCAAGRTTVREKYGNFSGSIYMDTYTNGRLSESDAALFQTLAIKNKGRVQISPNTHRNILGTFSARYPKTGEAIGKMCLSGWATALANPISDGFGGTVPGNGEKCGGTVMAADYDFHFFDGHNVEHIIHHETCFDGPLAVLGDSGAPVYRLYDSGAVRALGILSGWIPSRGWNCASHLNWITMASGTTVICTYDRPRCTKEQA